MTNSLVKHHPERAKWLSPLGLYLLFSALLGFVYLVRCMWAYPDVPYLTQLTAIDILEPALNGDFSPLWESFFRFEGEHKLFIYYIYLYANARFFSFTTHTEIYIWTISLFAQTLIVGAYVFRRFRIAVFSPRFLVMLLVPILSFTPLIASGRGMETQIQVSTTILVGFFFLIKKKISIRVFAPLAFALSGLYVILFAGAYASGAIFALTCGLLLCLIPGFSNRVETLRVAISAAFTWLWVGVYFLWYKSASGPPALEQETLLTLLSKDPVFAARYLAAGLAATVTNINMYENVGEDFFREVIVIGSCIAAVIIILTYVNLRCVRSRRDFLVPSLLILYGVGTILAVMLGRHPDPYWMLNGWYPFQFRLLADGVIMLTVATLSWRLWRQHITLAAVFCGLSIVVLSTFAVSSRYQYQRNKYERVYFQEIRNYVRETPPDSIRGDTRLTPIYLNSSGTADALRFLRDYRLVPFDKS
jgi:hypothetical protein